MHKKPKYNPEIHHRKSIRLKNYDYSQPGAYFVTICVQNRECMFGKIANNVMQLNEYGNIIYECLHDTYNHFPQIDFDYWTIMPNHFHGIVIINTCDNDTIPVRVVRAESPRPYNVVSLQRDDIGSPCTHNNISSHHDQKSSSREHMESQQYNDTSHLPFNELTRSQNGISNSNDMECKNENIQPKIPAFNHAVGAGSPRPYNVQMQYDNHGSSQWAGSPRPYGDVPLSRGDIGTPTLGKIIAYFKYQSTKQINVMRNSGIQKLWQRNYYEHIIRNKNELNRIREYIINNPMNWKSDRLYLEE